MQIKTQEVFNKIIHGMDDLTVITLFYK